MRTVFAGEGWTIATFSVPSVRGIRVECVLHHVHTGAAECVCVYTMRPFRDEGAPTRRVGQHQENRFTIWIAKQPAGGGKVKFLLESTGCAAEDSWHSGKCHDDLHLSHKYVLITGDVTEEVQEQDSAILFLGGEAVPFPVTFDAALRIAKRPDRVRADKRMTPMQFAERNKGRFLLVTLRWYIAACHLDEN